MNVTAFFLGAKGVGIHLAAREEDGVKISGVGIVEREIDRDGITPIFLIPSLDAPGLRRDDAGGGTGIFERGLGLEKF